MKILIGMPVYKRAWILRDWFAAIESQTIPLDQLGFIFELGPNDNETHDILYDWHAKHPQVFCFDGIIRENERHNIHPDGHRQWTHGKYYTMVNLRNNLLERATCLQPDRYFSLDSDILITNPNTIEHLVNLTETLDAVGLLCYMRWRDEDDIKHPSVMSWQHTPGMRAERRLEQYPLGSLFRSDVIMAAKMMSKQVYENVRYRWHRQGEDVGWSAEAYHQGFNLYCASDIYAPHIMHTFLLDYFKEKGDKRSLINKNVLNSLV